MMRRMIAVLIVVAGCATARPEVRFSPVYHVIDGRQVEMIGTTAKLVSIAPYSPRFDLVVPGRRAKYRARDRQPVFQCGCDVGDVRLVRLRPGDEHDDRNLSVRVASEGFSIRVLIPDQSTVELVIDGESQGLLRLSPRVPLEQAEYAFVSQSNLNTVSAVRVFDFGME